MKSIEIVSNPINSIKLLRINDDNDYDDNENRMSAISITTNDTVESSQSISNSIFKFFIDRRSIISIDTKSSKDSIGNSNTNWHSDRTLIYTYYSCLYDHNSLSPLSLILIIIFIPMIISLPNLIIPLGTIYDTNNSSSIINNNTINQQNSHPPINGIINIIIFTNNILLSLSSLSLS